MVREIKWSGRNFCIPCIVTWLKHNIFEHFKMQNFSSGDMHASFWRKNAMSTLFVCLWKQVFKCRKVSYFFEDLAVLLLWIDCWIFVLIFYFAKKVILPKSLLKWIVAWHCFHKTYVVKYIISKSMFCLELH